MTTAPRPPDAAVPTTAPQPDRDTIPPQPVPAPPHGPRRIWLFRLLVPAITAITLLLAAEIATRIVVAATIGRPRAESDDTLGWRATPDYRRSFPRRDHAGTAYTVDYRTDPHGFRAWGDPDADGTGAAADPSAYTIFIVGDSFTQAIDAGQADTWYAIMAARLGWRVFAVGAGGYGTLQEALLLEAHIARIQPDLVILQTSSNDFANNSYAFEMADWPNNLGRRRPYLEDGATVYRTPSRLGAAREFLNRHSQFGYLVSSRLDLATMHRHEAPLGESNPYQPDAVATTTALFRRVRATATAHGAQVRTLSFAEDPYAAALLARIGAEAGIPPIDGFAAALTAGDQGANLLRAADGTHLSAAGSRYAGDWLARWGLAHAAELGAPAPPADSGHAYPVTPVTPDMPGTAPAPQTP